MPMVLNSLRRKSIMIKTIKITNKEIHSYIGFSIGYLIISLSLKLTILPNDPIWLITLPLWIIPAFLLITVVGYALFMFGVFGLFGLLYTYDEFFQKFHISKRVRR